MLVKGKRFTPRKSSRTGTLAKMKQKVSRSILDSMHAGSATGWQHRDGESASPHNLVSGHKYTGTNLTFLTFSMMLSGTDDPRFCTVNQLEELGDECVLKEGAVGIPLLRPVEKEVEGDNSDTPDDEAELMGVEPDQGAQKKKTRKQLLFVTYNVYHASQIENCPPMKAAVADSKSTEMVEALVASTGVKVVQEAGAKPAYDPASDCITMPTVENLGGEGRYYSELARQWFYATGHKDRVHRYREESFQDNGFEALRAECFMAMFTAEFGLPLNQSGAAEYLEQWEERFEKDSSIVLKQCEQARSVMAIATAFAEGKSPKASWFPSKDQWTKSVDLSVPDVAERKEAEGKPRLESWEAMFDDFEVVSEHEESSRPGMSM